MVTPLPLVMSFQPTGELLDAARQCEADVFGRTYGNTAQEWQYEYGPYEDHSVFITLSERGGDVVGCCRLVLPFGGGLKSLDDVGRPPWFVDGYRSARVAGVQPRRTVDIATVGVRHGVKGIGTLAATALYHGIVLTTRANALPNIVMIMDERARRLLSAIGCGTHPLPGTGPAPYLGSPASTPLWAHVPSMMEVQRRTNPDGHRLISHGNGLAGIEVPAPAAFALSGRPAIGPSSSAMRSAVLELV